MHLIKFTNVSMKYGSNMPVLDNINFEIKPGSYHYLTGNSGTGKTTLMKLLYMGQMPTSGSIQILGHDVNRISRGKLTKLRREIGIVFQNFRLLNHLNIMDNIALPLRIASIHEDDIKNNVVELLQWVGLGDKIYEFPESLSGGEQQRAAIARAIINRPKILFADEPTGNIDENIGGKIMMLLEELNKLGTTVVVATHDESILKKFPHPSLNIENKKLILQPPRFSSEAA